MRALYRMEDAKDVTHRGEETMDDAMSEVMDAYKELIEYDNLKFLTLATMEEELNWAGVAEGCFACGTTQPDCELTWEVDGEALADVQERTDSDLRILCRPRRWICAFDTESGAARALCPSCYRLIQFDCIEGVWDAEFMNPAHRQMIMRFADTEAGAAP